MEQNNQPNPQNQDEIKISKKSLYIVGGIFGGFFLLAGSYFMFFNNKIDSVTTKTDSLNIKTDSTNLVKTDRLNLSDEYDEENPYGEYYIIANEITLPMGQKLNFGDKVYKDYSKSGSSEDLIYLNDPIKYPSIKSSPISINSNFIADNYDFENYKKYFSNPPYSTLPIEIKKFLNSKTQEYSNGRYYELSQNSGRAKSTLAVGDFDSDGSKDFAVVMDNVEDGQESRFMIISTNKSTKAAYVAYAANFDDRVMINSFKKGASVYINSYDFVKAPHDGVLLKNEYGSTIVIYDAKAQKYKVYEQRPAEIPTATADDVEE